MEMICGKSSDENLFQGSTVYLVNLCHFSGTEREKLV